MKVKELIEELSKLDQEKPIKIISWDGCGGYESQNEVFVNDYQKTKVQAYNNGQYSHEYYGIQNYTEDNDFYYLSDSNDVVQKEHTK